MSYEKVFGIGLNKTGTTTLGDMFGQMGLRHQSWHPPTFALYQQDQTDEILATTTDFDSFTDWPWPLITPQLVDHFGDTARFILTRRASSKVWVESLKSHALATKPVNNARLAVYGFEYPQENEAGHMKFYNDHLDQTRQLFLDHGLEHALLELCWEDGDGWKDLAEFLDRPAPRCALPHHNSRLRRRKTLPNKAANLARISSLVAQNQWADNTA